MEKLEIKYLFITNSATGGGAERAVNIVVRTLQEINPSTGLLTLNSGPADLIRVKNHEFNIGREWRSGLFPTLQAGFRFYKKVKLIDPKVIIANCELPELMIALFVLNRKIICVEHVRMPWKNRRFLGFVIRFLLLLKGVTWVTVSPYLRPWCQFVRKTLVIRNPVLAESLNKDGAEYGNGSTEVNRLIFVGRLTAEQKRPEWLLQICASLSLPAKFVGAGDERKRLEDLALELQVKCEFRGQSSNPWESWGQGDLLIVPSAWEGDGLVVVEAILLEIPILLSDIPEFRFFGLDDKFYCKNPAEFSTRIVQYRSDYSSLIVPKEIRENLKAIRDPNVIASQWKELLDKF